MLPAAHRLRSSEDFRRVVRQGGRAASDGVVAHVLARAGEPTRVGLIVSKSVGGAVERNLVKRRLRAIVRPDVIGSVGDAIVLRALPQAGRRSYQELDEAVQRAVARARRASRR